MPLLLALLFCFVYVVMDNVATSPASSGYTQSAGLKASAAEATAQTLRAYHAAAVAWLEQPAQASFVGTVPSAVVVQALAQQSILPGNYTTFRAADGLTTTWLSLGPNERVKNARVGDIAAALIRAVSMRQGFQLPISSACPDRESEADVVQASHAAPDNHIAGRRIVAAGEIAAEHRDLQQVGVERSSLQAWP